jgi:hypothetical protein
MGTLDTGASSICLAELVCWLPDPHSLQGLMMFPSLQTQDARFLLRSCALRTGTTRSAVEPCKACFKSSAIGRISVRQPGNALLAGRARDNLCLPVDQEQALIESSLIATASLGPERRDRRSQFRVRVYLLLAPWRRCSHCPPDAPEGRRLRHLSDR